MDRSVYQRPNKPKYVHVRTRNQEAPAALPELSKPVIVDRATECHVTPPDVAARMVEYLGGPGEFLTLEPSAGTGNLAAALIEAGYRADNIVAVERHHELCNFTRQRVAGINPLHRCFIDYADEVTGRVEFPRILMNPPFRAVRQHMARALSLLGRSSADEQAVLVALVPITYQHAEAELVETLGADTFASCQVNTKIVRFTL